MRILLIDGDTSSRDTIVAELRGGLGDVDTVAVARQEDAAQALAAGAFDVVVVRVYGPEALPALDPATASGVPLLAVVDPDCEPLALDCMARGLDDYVSTAGLRRLPFAVRRSVERAELARRLAFWQSQAEASREDASRLHVAIANSSANAGDAEEIAARLESDLTELEAVVSSMTEGLIVFDLHGNVLEMNPAALRIHGLAAREEARLSSAEYAQYYRLSTLDGEELPSPSWPIARVLRGETFTGFDLRVETHDGRHVFVGSYSGAPVRDREGHINLGVLTVRDVTERRQAEQLRELNLARLRALVEVSAGVLAESTAAGVLRKVVETARRLTSASMSAGAFGWQDGRFQDVTTIRQGVQAPSMTDQQVAQELGRVYTELGHTEASWLRRPSGLCADEEGGQSGELIAARLVTAGGAAAGTLAVCSKRAGLFTSEDEALVVQLAGLASLGLQHVEARREAARRVDEMDAVFASLVEGVIVYNEAGEPTKANPAALAAFGLDRIVPRVTPEQREAYFHRLNVRYPDGTPVPREVLPHALALQGRRVTNEHFLFQNAAGEERHVRVSAAPIVVRGERAGLVATWHDVTDREQLLAQVQAYAAELASREAALAETAARLREARDELEIRVQERTAELLAANRALQAEVAQRQRAEAHARQQAERTQALVDVTQALVEASPDYEAVLSLVVRRVVELIGDACVLARLSEDGRHLVPISFYHADPEAAALMSDLFMSVSHEAGENPSGQVVQTGVPLLRPVVTVEQMRATVNEEYWPYLDQFGMHSLLIVPLRAHGGTIIGTLGLSRDRAGNPYTEEDKAFLMAVADTAAIALANAQLYGELAAMNSALMSEIGERQQVEAWLAQQAETLREQADLLDLSHDAIIVRDIDGRIRFWNRSAAERYGWTREEVVGKVSHDLFQTVFTSSKEEAYATLFAQDYWEGELIHTRRDGEQITVSARWSLQRDGEGRPQAVMEINTDITEYKRAQTRVAYQAHLLANISDAVIATDADLHITAWNRAAELMYGYPAEEMLGRPLHEVLPQMPVGEELMRRGEDGRYRSEVVVFGRGEPRISEVTGMALRDGTGDVSGYVTVHRDVTERRRAEQALRESEERFRALFERAGIGIALVDEDGHTLSANPALQRMLGYSEEELSQLSIADISYPNDVVIDMMLFRELWAGQRAYYELRKRHVHKEGWVIWVYVSATLVRDQAGRPLFGVRMLQDITEQELAARALDQSAKRLRLLHVIDRAILAAQSPTDIAQVAVSYIREIIPCLRASVVLFDYTAARALVLAAASQAGIGLPAGSTLGLVECRIDEAFRSGQVFTQEDLAALPDAFPVEQALVADGVRSHTRVPLVVSGQLIGSLNIALDVPGILADEYVEVARQLADSLAVAIHNARLFEQVRTSQAQLQDLSRRLVQVQEEERRAIARELHDEAGQSLSSLKIALGLLARQQSGSQLSNRLEELKQTVDGVLEGLHRLAVNLRPAALDKAGLLPALRQHIDTVQQQTGLEMSFASVGLDDDRVDPEVETAIYRIVQEALTNVVRHAHAQNIGVVLQRQDGHLIAIVEDDGVGFDPDRPAPETPAIEAGAARRSHLGLVGMRERAEMLGGTLTVESSAGAGTTIYVDIPLKAK